MNICYMLSSNILKSDNQQQILNSIIACLKNKHSIKQLFFYSDASQIASLENYPETIEKIISLADDNDIKLFVCRAAFQKRNYKQTSITQQDFQFMGLGQFLSVSLNSDKTIVF